MAENKVIIEFVPDTSKLKPGFDAVNAELKKTTGLTEEMVIEFAQTNKTIADGMNKIAASTKPVVVQLQEMTSLIQGEVIKEFGSELTQAATKTVTLTQELKKLTNEIASGKLDGKDLEKAKKRAGELKDRISDVRGEIAKLGSDTRVFDLLVEGGRAAAAGFSVAQGAAALFGQENKELQESILKAQGALALLTGTQEIANVLTTEGGIASKAYAFALGIVDKAQKASAASLALMTGGITLLVGAIAYLIYNLDEADTATVELTQAQKDANFTLEKTRIEYLKVTGAIDAYTAATKLAGLETAKTIDEINAKVEKDVNEAQTTIGQSLLTLLEFYGVRRMDGEQRRAEIRKKIEKDAAKEIEAIQKQAAEEQAIRTAEEYKRLQLQILAERKAALDESLILTKDYSKKEFQLQVEAINLERDTKLKQIALDNIDDVEQIQQKLLIQTEAEQKIKELRQRFYVEQLQQQAKQTAALLTQQIEGSKAELDMRIKLIKQSAAAEAAAVKEGTIYTEKQRADILLKSYAEISAARIAYSEAADKKLLESELTGIKTRIAATNELDIENLNAKLELIDIEAGAEIAARTKGLENEKEILAIGNQVEQEALNKRLQATLAYYNAINTIKQDQLNKDIAHAKAQAQLELGNAGQGPEAAFQLKLKQYDIEDARLNEQSQHIEEVYAKRVEEYKKAGQSTLELDRQYANERMAIADAIALNDQAKANETFEHNKKLQDMYLAYSIQIARQITDAIVAEDINRSQRELEIGLAKLQTEKSKELENKELTEGQKAAIDKRFEREAAALKLQQWKAEQQAKLTQAIINGALGITTSLASSPVAIGPVPNPAGIASLALVAATTAIQIATIASAKPPQFAKGSEYVQRGDAPMGTDTIHAMINEGERIVPTEINRKLKGVKNEHLPELINIAQAALYPAMPQAPDITGLQVVKIDAPAIDYSKLAKAIATELRANPQQHLTIDKNGFSLSLIEAGRKLEILNNRYASK